MVVNRLKNFLIRKVYFPITSNKKIQVPNGTPRIFLFGMPQHMNYGDLAIYIAERKFLNKIIPEAQLITIPERFITKEIPHIKSLITPDDIVALHGGGNMGDVWPDVDNLRQNVLDSFHDYHIVSFPQSVTYSSETWLKDMNKELIKCANIDVFARDKASFNIMKNNFPNNVRYFLTPDIVLSFEPNIRKNQQRDNGILFLLRRDKEKENNNLLIRLKKFVTEHYEFTISDTVDNNWHIITTQTIDKFVNRKLKQINNSSLVITDRLHGMIFSKICHTPVIVFDNNNHKIRNSYKSWLTDDKGILFVSEDTTFDHLKQFIYKQVNQDSNHLLQSKVIGDSEFRPLKNAFLNNRRTES